MNPRNVAFSRTRLTELMVPSYANFGGKVHAMEKKRQALPSHLQ
ncbi:hypothetical protein [Alteromonas sp. P256]